MDKFDQAIKNAQKDSKPTSDFVERTMNQIGKHSKKRGWSPKIWLPALAGSLAVIAVLVLTIAPLSHTLKSSTQNPQPTQSQPVASSGSATSGTNTASLTNDLNGINSAINQENNDQSSANNALNDQSQEITIPTD